MTRSPADREFELQYEQAKDLLKAFPDYQFRTVTVLVVIIGWLLTAASAREFIATHASLALPATLFSFGLLIIFKFIWIIGFVKRAQRVYQRLEQLAERAGVSVQTVERFKLSPLLAASYLAVNVLLCLAVITIVWVICS